MSTITYSISELAQELDITTRTIPEDFARNQRIHHCYLVRRTPRKS